eukprot:TRINITY_DN300_c0_g1_i7.p1 TRINITY_DN300_c0_g1~~TRINITY_DN300_c0_g1_i7.p1  ORF type:complete len:211 (+),score=19.74 TRINITY_DN300_c0_g1_i7:2-634(+)
MYFASVSTDASDTVNIYKLSDYSIHKKISTSKLTYGLSFSPDWTKLVVVGEDDMEVYSVDTGSLLEAHDMPSSPTPAVSYFHTSDTIITGEGVDTDARILLWNDGAPTPAPPSPVPAPPTVSDTLSVTPSLSSTGTLSLTQSLTTTATGSLTLSPSVTETVSASATPSPTGTLSASRTDTATPTVSDTLSVTQAAQYRLPSQCRCHRRCL